jgi:hypothetical protein
MTLGLTISLCLGLGLTCFGAGWLTAHAIKSRSTRSKSRPR